MKLLINRAAWKQWIKDEEGRFAALCGALRRFAEVNHAPPKTYPCYAYMELESWGQETLRSNYLYQHDVDAMAMALFSISQKM